MAHLVALTPMPPDGFPGRFTPRTSKEGSENFTPDKQLCQEVSIELREEVLEADAALRFRKFAEAQLAAEQLKSWAGVHRLSEAIMAVQRHTQIFSNFSSKNQTSVSDI